MTSAIAPLLADKRTSGAPQDPINPFYGYTAWIDSLLANRLAVRQLEPIGTVAVCSIDGADIASWLVRNGHAFDWPQYSRGKYAAEQKEAERTGRGVWAGSYVVPWAHRACARNGGRPMACSDDAIAY